VAELEAQKAELEEALTKHKRRSSLASHKLASLQVSCSGCPA